MGTISGIVIAAESGHPVALARVTAIANDVAGDVGNTARNGHTATTDDRGHYEINGLPPGRYRITAAKTGFVRVDFGQQKTIRPGHAVEVREGEHVREVDFRLPRCSAITGRIFDQDGEPIVHASVSAARLPASKTALTSEVVASAQSDDRGVFRVYPLEPGTYVVWAVPNVDLARGSLSASVTATARRTLIESTHFVEGASAPIAYAPTFYPGGSALRTAAPVDVPVATEVADVDFMMPLVRTGQVRGMVVSATGTTVSNDARVWLVPEELGGVMPNYGARTEPDGRFTFPNVLPGPYLAVAQSENEESGTLYAVARVLVSPEPCTLALPLLPGATVSGKVVADSTNQIWVKGAAGLSVGLERASDSVIPNLRYRSVKIGPDPAFTVTDVPPRTTLDHSRRTAAPLVIEGDLRERERRDESAR